MGKYQELSAVRDSEPQHEGEADGQLYDEFDEIEELDDIDFTLDEVESKIAPLALAAN